jgi:hypothetical protein
MVSQQIIQKFQLNHGLFLNGHKIEPSKRAVLVGDGVLNISLYREQPLVYISVNDRNSHKNLLRFDSDDNDVELDESLQSSDMCINFPIAEITYTADLLESFSKFEDDVGKLYEAYGHLFARKILVGGKLFIDDFNSATSTQIDMFKSLLTWVYDSAKYDKKIPFDNLSFPDLFPNIRTSDEENLNTLDKLINWMDNLYQKNMTNIISYNDLIPISELKSSTTSQSPIDDRQPGIANFKRISTLKEWIEDSIYCTSI